MNYLPIIDFVRINVFVENKWCLIASSPDIVSLSKYDKYEILNHLRHMGWIILIVVLIDKDIYAFPEIIQSFIRGSVILDVNCECRC